MNQRFTKLVDREGLVAADLDRLKEAVALDYPSDPMMQDLRLVRTLHELAEKRLTLAELHEEMVTSRKAAYTP